MSIPKVLHQFWTGPPMPQVFADFAEGWKRLHPAWEYRLWGDGDLPPLQNQYLYDRAKEIAPRFVGQMRSDVLRYELLYQFGGVWIDTDFECLKPIDELLDGVGCFAAWVQTDLWINNAIMGASPGHPFIGRLIDGLPANVVAKRGLMPNKLTGPQYMTGVWREHPEGVTLFPKAMFYPYLWSELWRGRERFEGCYGVHHWGNRRRGRGVPL